MKKKILVIICIIFIVIASVFGTQSIIKKQNADALRLSANEEVISNAGQVEYTEIELNQSNCKYFLNEQTQTVEIEEYKGNEDCIIIPEAIEGYPIENVNIESFSDCYNLETIKVPQEIANQIGEIPDFEITETTEEYVVYTTTREYSQTYEAYLELTDEERAKIGVIPDKYNVPMEKIYSTEMEELYGISVLANEDALESYDLREKIDIDVENQKAYGNCYAHASFAAAETNLVLTQNEVVDFSEVHAAVMTTGYGGYLFSSTNYYYTSNAGPIFEEDCAMDDVYENTSDTNYSIIDTYLKGGTITSSQLAQIQDFVTQDAAVKYVTETVRFPSITGSMKADSTKQSEIESTRKAVKEHIKTYGAVAACIAMSGYEEYNGYMVLNNSTSSVYDHGITIVGWDDNFSKENFPTSCRPDNDGAYLVLNSWGDSWGDDGYFWVSYEDIFIEENLLGVIKVEEVTENLNVGSITVKNINTNDIIKADQIKKGEEIEINFNAIVSDLTDGTELQVTLRNSEQDLTENIYVTGNELVNKQANVTVYINTRLLEGGQYILEITYGDETSSKLLEIIVEFYYSVNSDGTITITDYAGKDKDVIIPSEYDGYKVTTIGTNAFLQKNVDSVVISEGITTIADYAFSNCTEVKQVSLPDSLTSIGLGSFISCSSLESIIIPRSVTSIGGGAFQYCTNLEKIVIFRQTMNINSRYPLLYGCANPVVYCESGSTAESYAKSSSYDYYILSEYYEIKYDADAGNDTVENMPDSQSKLEYDRINLSENIPVRSGYDFLGWSITKGSEQVDYLPGDKYEQNNDVTLYGVWIAEENIQVIDISEYSFKDKTVTYDGNIKTIEVEGYPSDILNVSYTVSANGESSLLNEKAINAGEYTILATYTIKEELKTYVFKDGINEQTATLTIDKAIGNIQILDTEGLNKTYDGEPIENPICRKSGSGTVSFEYYEGEKAEGERLSSNPVNAGVYTVKVILEESGNYTSSTEEAVFEISKAAYDMTGVKFEDATYEYDGAEKKIEITGDLPEGVEVSYENNTAVNVGEYTAVAKFSNPDELNYKDIENMTATLKITQGEGYIVITNKTLLNREYGKPVVEPICEKIGNGEIQIEYYKGADTTGEIMNNIPEDVGTYTVKVILEETQNYTSATDEATFNITKTTYNMSNVKFEDTTYEYDGTEKKIEITGDLPEGVEVSYENNIAVNVGEYTAIAKFSNPDELNYENISNMTAVMKITKKAGKITITNKTLLNKVYDGTPIIEPTYEKIGDGEVEIQYYKGMNATGELMTTAPINAGKYTLKVILKEGTNYTSAVEQINIEIQKATYDMSGVKFEDVTYEYDGTEKKIEIIGDLPEGVEVSYENNKAVEAGEYAATARFTIPDEENYNPISDMTATLKIIQAPGKITITNKNLLSKVYDGMPVVEPVFSKTGDGEVEITYYKGADLTGELMSEAPVNVGIYTVKVLLKATENYKEASDIATFEISKATYNMSNVKFEDITYEYDGAEKEIEINGDLPEGVDVSYENNKATNVGEYVAVARFTIPDEENYNPISDMTATLKIIQAPGKITITNAEQLNKVYDGNPIVEAIYESNSGGEVEIQYYKENSISGELMTTLPVNAGTYSVKAILKETTNYTSATKEVNFEIKKATYDMSNVKFEDATYEYDGTEKKVEIVGKLPEGVEVSYENNTGTDVGEYIAIAKFSNPDTLNYKDIENMTAVLKITKKRSSITITNKELLNKVYDGTTIVEPTYEKIGDGNVRIEYYKGHSKEGNLISGAPINAGMYTVKVIQEETENYMESTAEATFEIRKATYDMAGVKFENATYEYDGTEKKLEITGDLPEGVEVSYENNIAIDVGEHLAIARFSNPDALNYEDIEDMTATLKIKPAVASITITNKELLNKVYDGNPVIEPIYEKTSDGNVRIEYYEGEVAESNLMNAAPINVGKYTVKVILEKYGNYDEATAEATFEISKARYDMSNAKFEDTTYEYDGTEKKIEIIGKLPQGVSVNYENNTAIEIGEYIATAKFTIADKRNYNEIEDMTATLKIVQASGKITITNAEQLNKMYDKKPVIEPLYEKTGDGNVQIEYYEGESAEGNLMSTIPTNVGKYTVKVILEETKNYTSASAEATFEIKKATYDMSGVKFEDVTYEYDGTEKKVEITGKLPDGVEVSYENNTRIQVGEQVAIAKFSNPDTLNYKDIENMEAVLKITKKRSTITITNKELLNKVYDGTTIVEPTYEKTGDGNVRIEYYKGYSEEGNLISGAPINAGIYTVKVIQEETENYMESTAEATIEIRKATYDMAGVKFENATYEYDGTEKKIEITGDLPEGVDVKYENNTATEIGKYVAIARFSNPDIVNYKDIEDMTAILEITKKCAEITITNKDLLNKVYDGTAIIEPTYEKTGDGNVRIEYYKGDSEEGNLINEAPIDAGIYTVKIILEETENYTSATAEATIEIKKATYDMSGVKFEKATYEYDGTEKKIEITGDLPDGVSVSYENNTAINAGEYNAIAIFTILDEKNYNEISNMVAVLKITQTAGNIFITNKEDLNKVYDKNPVIEPIYEKTGDGNVQIEYYEGEIAEGKLMSTVPENVGLYTVKVILEETENYTSATAEATFEISKATYDMSGVKFEDATYEYDGTEKKVEIVGDLPDGVSVSYENNTATEVGEYTAIARFEILDKNNYYPIKDMTAVLRITKPLESIIITNKKQLNKVYDGNPVSDPIYEKMGNGTVRIKYYKENPIEENLMSTLPTNAGKYIVRVILEDAESNTLAVDEATFEISKATYDMSNVKFEDATYEYDGTEKKLEVIGDLPEGVDVSYENNTAVNIGEYIATAKFTILDTENYNEISNMTATLRIVKAKGSIIILDKEQLNKVYDMNPVMPALYKKTGRGEVQVQYYVGEKAEGERLSAYPVNAGIYTVKVMLEETEEYTSAEDIATFEISKATYNMSSVKFEDATYEYDGTEKKVEITGKLPEGVSVSYENNTATDVGEYIAIAKFESLDKNNYHPIENMTAVLTITEKVEIDFGKYRVIEENNVSYLELVEENTTLEAFKENFSNQTVEVYEEGKQIEDAEKLIATGMRVKVTKQNKTKECQVVIKGDMTGDGMVNDQDLLRLARYMIGCEKEKELLKGAYLRASDTYEDGENATDKDLLKLARILLK